MKRGDKNAAVQIVYLPKTYILYMENTLETALPSAVGAGMVAIINSI
jgi:hypothetical protein